MNERDAFIAAIIANPKDYGLRLILADKLMELGEYEREEFIRVQCRLAGGLKCTTTVGYPPNYICDRAERFNCTRCLPMIRERELINEYYDEWFSTQHLHGANWGIPLLPTELHRRIPNIAQCIVSRGFVSEVHCPLSAWMEHGPRLVREHPIEVVRATDVEPVEVGDLLASLNPNRFVFFRGDSFVGPAMYATHPVFMQLKRRLFVTREAAVSALSDALIAWAKAQQPVEVVK